MQKHWYRPKKTYRSSSIFGILKTHKYSTLPTDRLYSCKLFNEAGALGYQRFGDSHYVSMENTASIISRHV